MTNKSLFIIIFVICVIGLVTGINIFYQQVINPSQSNELNVSLLKEKLKASEDQIRIISNENGVLRSELYNLKNKLDKLYSNLDNLNLDEEQEKYSIKDSST